MNVENYFQDYLEKHTELVLPTFGIFRMENRQADLQQETKQLLPPQKKLSFERNTSVSNLQFSQFLAEKTGQPLHVIHSNLVSTIEEWNKKLLKKEKVNLSQLGVISDTDGQVHFEPSNLIAQEFFGLETIQLEELNKTTIHLPLKEEKTNLLEKISMILFLIILPIIGLAVIAFNYREALFGNASSIGELPKMVTAIRRIDNHTIQKKQNINTENKHDTIKNKTLKIDSLVPKKTIHNEQ